uniref:Cardiomyopathy associated 5 n=1 Tax=Ornithorhynchus anatinus TaxID=9258 RepID=A0A6I8NZ63_ORNAN
PFSPHGAHSLNPHFTGEETEAQRSKVTFPRLTDHLQDEEAKSREQCIISDPSFSMVTIQREDSGITWETNSSRCSTPWASEGSSTPDIYSPESSTVSSPPGNVSFIMDEGKKMRKRSRKSSKRSSPSLRRKRNRKSPSPEAQLKGLEESKDHSSISNGEKPPIGPYDKTRKKKTTSNTPPITGAIYKEYKPLDLKPVYIGTVQYKIKMFNSVKEEIIPLQFYGTLPKGYVIKEISYRKGKDASVTLEPASDSTLPLKTDRSFTHNIEKNKETWNSAPWRETLSKESRSGSSMLNGDIKQRETLSPSPAYSTNKGAADKRQPRTLGTPEFIPPHSGDEVEKKEREPDAPVAAPSPQKYSASAEAAGEESERDSQLTATAAPGRSISPPVAPGEGKEGIESDSPPDSEPSVSLEAEKDGTESEPPAVTSEVSAEKEDKPEIYSLEKAETEAQLGIPPYPIQKEEEERIDLDFPGVPTEHSGIGEETKEDVEPFSPLTATSGLDQSYLSEEEVIEIEAPESLSGTENSVPPYEVHEMEKKEIESGDLLTTTSPSKHAVVSEGSEGEKAYSPDSAFASENELDKKAVEPGCSPNTSSATEHVILSEEDDEKREAFSPVSVSVSEDSIPPYATEKDDIAPDSSHGTITTSGQVVRSEQEDEEMEAFSPDSASVTEYSLPPHATGKKGILSDSSLGTITTTEQVVLTEEDDEKMETLSPDPVSGSGYSIPSNAPEKKDVTPDSSRSTITTSEHVVLPGDADVEPLSQDSASVSEYSIPPCTTEKKDNVPDSSLSTMTTTEHIVLSEEDDAEEMEPFSPDSAFVSEYSVPPYAAEKKDVMPDSSLRTITTTEHIVLSEEDDEEEMEPFSPDSASVSEYSVPPYATEKKDIEPDSSLRTITTAEHIVLSEEDDEEKMEPFSPDSASVSEFSVPPYATEKKDIEPDSSLRTITTAEHIVLSEEDNEEEVEPFSPDSAFMSEYSVPPYAAEQKDAMPDSSLSTITTTEHIVLSEEDDEEEEMETFSPDSASVSEYSIPLYASERKDAMPDSSVSTVTTMEQIFLSEEDEEEERGPFSPDSASVSEYSIPPYATHEELMQLFPSKKEIDFDSSLNAASASERVVFSEEEKENRGPFSPDSAFMSEYSISPFATKEPEKKEFEYDSSLRSTPASDRTIISEEENEEMAISSPDSALVAEYSAPPFQAHEPDRNYLEPGSLLTAMSVSECSLFSEAEKEETESDTQPPSKTVSEHLILSQRRKTKPPSPMLETKHLASQELMDGAEKEINLGSLERAASASESVVSPKGQGEGHPGFPTPTVSVSVFEKGLEPGPSGDFLSSQVGKDEIGPAPQEISLSFPVPSPSSQKQNVERGSPKAPVSVTEPSITPFPADEPKEAMKPKSSPGVASVSECKVLPDAEDQKEEEEDHHTQLKTTSRSGVLPEVENKEKPVAKPRSSRQAQDLASSKAEKEVPGLSKERKEELQGSSSPESTASGSEPSAVPPQRKKTTEPLIGTSGSEPSVPPGEREENIKLCSPGDSISGSGHSVLPEERKEDIKLGSPRESAPTLEHSAEPPHREKDIELGSQEATTSKSENSFLPEDKKKSIETSPTLTTWEAEHTVLNKEGKKDISSGLQFSTAAAYESSILSKVEKKETEPRSQPPKAALPDSSVLEVGRVENETVIPPTKTPSSDPSVEPPKTIPEHLSPPFMPQTWIPLSSADETEEGKIESHLSEEKRKMEAIPHESEKLMSEELIATSPIDTGDRNRHELISHSPDKEFLPEYLSEKSGGLLLSFALETGTKALQHHTPESPHLVSEESSALINENVPGDLKQAKFPLPGTGSLMPETQTMEFVSTSEEGTPMAENLSAKKLLQETPSHIPEVVHSEPGKLVTSSDKEDNLRPQSYLFSLKSLVEEPNIRISKDLAGSEEAVEETHILPQVENLAAQGTKFVLTKHREELDVSVTTQSLTEKLETVASGLQEEHKEQETFSSDKVHLLSDVLITSPPEVQILGILPETSAGTSSPGEETQSAVPTEFAGINGAQRQESPPPQGSQSFIKGTSKGDFPRPFEEREQLDSSDTKQTILEEVKPASPGDGQTYGDGRRDTLVPLAGDVEVSSPEATPDIGRSADNREEMGKAAYPLEGFQVSGESKIAVPVENTALDKQIHSLVESDSLILEKPNTEFSRLSKGNNQKELFSEGISGVLEPAWLKHETPRPESIASSFKEPNLLEEEAKTTVGSSVDDEDLGSLPFSTVLEEPKMVISKTVKDTLEAQEPETSPVPKAKMPEESTWALIQIDEGAQKAVPPDSSEGGSRVTEQQKPATPDSKVNKGASSFTSWMTSLFFGGRSPKSNRDETEGLETPPGPSVETDSLVEESKASAPIGPADFNEAQKPALPSESELRVSPEEEPKTSWFKPREEKRQERTPPERASGDLEQPKSAAPDLTDEARTKESEKPKAHSVPEFKILTVEEFQKAVIKDGGERAQGETPGHPAKKGERLSEQPKPDSEGFIEVSWGQDPQLYVDERADRWPEEPANANIDSTQDRVKAAAQLNTFPKEVEKAVPVAEDAEEEQKPEIHRPFEAKVPVGETKSAPANRAEERDQGEICDKGVEDQAPPMPASSDFTGDSVTWESQTPAVHPLAETRILAVGEAQPDLLKRDVERKEEKSPFLPSAVVVGGLSEPPKAYASFDLSEAESKLRPESHLNDKADLGSRPYSFAEINILEEKSDKVAPFIPRDVSERNVDFSSESRPWKSVGSKELEIFYCNEKGQKESPLDLPGRTGMVTEPSTAPAPSLTKESNKEQIPPFSTGTSSLLAEKSVVSEEKILSQKENLVSQRKSSRETNLLSETGVSGVPKKENERPESHLLSNSGVERLELEKVTALVDRPEEEERLFYSSKRAHIEVELPETDASQNLRQTPQPDLAIVTGRVSEESVVTLDRPSERTEHLAKQQYPLAKATLSFVESQTVVSKASPETQAAEKEEISPSSPPPPPPPPRRTVHTTQMSKDIRSSPPTLSPLASKQISSAVIRSDAVPPKPFPLATGQPEQMTEDKLTTNLSEAGPTEVTPKEPEILYAKEEKFADPLVSSKSAGFASGSEDQKNQFNIISDSCEILSIHAPAFISSADQEESKKMQEEVEYLEESASLKTGLLQDDRGETAGQKGFQRESPAGPPDDGAIEVTEKSQTESPKSDRDISANSQNDELGFGHPDTTSDVDYFEKYTLIDYNINPEPEEQKPIQTWAVQEQTLQKASKGTDLFPESPEESEFYVVELDSAFHGTEKKHDRLLPADSAQFSVTPESADQDISKEANREDVDLKVLGAPLSDTKEAILSQTVLFPPADPDRRAERPASEFFDKVVSQEAAGGRRKEGQVTSDGESLNSEAPSPGRDSDADEGTGLYFEKYTLKDDFLHGAPGPQKDQNWEDKPGSGEDSYLLLPEGEEVWGRLGTILEEENMGKEEKPICRDRGGVGGGVEDSNDHGLQKEAPVMEEIKMVTQKITYAIPFEDTHNVLERVDESASQTDEETALAGADQHFPLQTPCQEEGFVSEEASWQDNQQEQAKIASTHIMQEYRSGDRALPQEDRDFAESIDFELVSQEDVLSEELLFSESAPEDVLSEEKESFEHVSESYEFVREPEPSTFAEWQESGLEIGRRKSPVELSETETTQKESNKSQIDAFCYTCKCPIPAADKVVGIHKDHEVSALDTAISVVKVQLGEFLENLQEKSLKIEAFVTEIESFFNTIEENCSKNEKLLEEQNEEMMKKVLAQYDEKAQGFEEVKRRKMSYLHDQMVSFLQSMESAKETLETIVKEAEELDESVFLTSFKEINERLLSAMENTASLEKMPTAFSLFEHYSDSSARSNQMLKHMAVPQAPRLEPQEANSATGTTIAVYWSVSKGDIIDSFQVYCVEEPQDDREPNALVEEYRVTVKESYCVFEDLEPDRCYEVWVMAVNFTGCSLPSERALFKTAPSTPAIKAEDCTVCWNTATIRWSKANAAPTDTYTVEYCRQNSPEGEGLRSFSGIKGTQLKVNLQPNDNYFFYAKAVNAFGTSEQSEAALISTRGTRFLLLRETAHPALQISADGMVICFTERRRLTEIPSVLGERLPAGGQHYWETTVADCPAYRIGICSASSEAPGSALGRDNAAWYMHCSEPQRYQFFSNGVVSNVHVSERPARVGVLLDYGGQRLLFRNAQSGQLLFIIRHRFGEAAHPAFALERPGVLTLHTGIEPPDLAKHK